MQTVLPDITQSTLPSDQPALNWVGMQGIDLPISISDAHDLHQAASLASVEVDLPDPRAKGIHMSRLYRMLDTLSATGLTSPVALQIILNSMIESHTECGTRSARLSLSFSHTLRRSALATKGLSGWNAYPTTLKASVVDNEFRCTASLVIRYSSTCPCSAALSRQALEQAFLDAFGQYASIEPAKVAAWLSLHGSFATPHSQRSEAHVTVDLTSASAFRLRELIDAVENAVATPVQTAVKRADEQAFARLNGENLMFVEDAARRIATGLQHFSLVSVDVRHLESLHPHDAVANFVAPTSVSSANA